MKREVGTTSEQLIGRCDGDGGKGIEFWFRWKYLSSRDRNSQRASDSVSSTYSLEVTGSPGRKQSSSSPRVAFSGKASE